MTLSSALARSTRATGSYIGLFVVGVIVLVSALCHLAQILPSGAEHDAALSHSSVSISATESFAAPALRSESDRGNEHSCQHELATAAQPQAPALTAVANLAIFDSPTNPTADTLSPLGTDGRHLPGPRQHVLCVLRT
jgi:hypothetical protein